MGLDVNESEFDARRIQLFAPLGERACRIAGLAPVDPSSSGASPRPLVQFLNIAEAVLQSPSPAAVSTLARHAALDLECATAQTMIAFANILEAHDPFTSGHSRRVGKLARLVGATLGACEPDGHELERAGLLHDIGKLGIPEAILNKPGPLTPEEFERVKTHPRLGHRMLRPVAALRGVLDGILYHHENWDGSGYPMELAGEQIPLQARILRVVDTFDAMTSARPYRGAVSVRVTLRTIADGAGTEFDPQIVRALLHTIRQMRGPQRSDVWAALPATVTH